MAVSCGLHVFQGYWILFGIYCSYFADLYHAACELKPNDPYHIGYRMDENKAIIDRNFLSVQEKLGGLDSDDVVLHLLEKLLYEKFEVEMHDYGIMVFFYRTFFNYGSIRKFACFYLYFK